MYYNENGIATASPIQNKFWIYEFESTFSFNFTDRISDIDTMLVLMQLYFKNRIIGADRQLQDDSSQLLWHSYAGISPESSCSKDEFQSIINKHNDSKTNTLLYLHDVENLIGSLQNLNIESKYLFCGIYKELSEVEVFKGYKPESPDMIFFTCGQIVTNVFSKINHLIINIASQLDYITKLAFEAESCPKDFTIYPKLKSKGILYGDAGKLKHLDKSNTVFEKTDTVKYILSLRNEIVHNASIEGNPKVYFVYKDNELFERFIYLPDTTDGLIDTCKNRNRFYSQGIKLNEMLPKLIAEIWELLEVTISGINRYLVDVANLEQNPPN